MEHMGVVADGEWDSFSKMFTNEDFDFTHQQFGFHQNDAGLHFTNTSPFCATSEANESLFFSNNFLNFSRDNSSSGGDSSNCSSFFIPTSTHESYFFNDNNDDNHNNNNVMMSVKNHHHDHDHDHDDASMAMDICIMDHKSIGSHVSAFSDDGNIVANNVNEVNLIGDKLGKVENINEERSEARVCPAMESQLKRKFDAPGLHTRGGDDRNDVNSFENLKKKPRVSNRGKKNVITKKNGQIQNENGKINGGEESNGGSEGQSSSSYCSEEENASQETNGGAISTSSESKASLALNLNGKPRAGRGSATDPQSLYARKRRERINERLKILQNLVPNGTKVDISTMLEEAVHYVKFLQLQIKLLSSDEHWMYAPIAYNGMDIGLNQKLSSLV